MLLFGYYLCKYPLTHLQLGELLNTSVDLCADVGHGAGLALVQNADAPHGRETFSRDVLLDEAGPLDAVDFDFDFLPNLVGVVHEVPLLAFPVDVNRVNDDGLQTGVLHRIYCEPGRDTVGVTLRL